jgi:DNA topoisomerase-1
VGKHPEDNQPITAGIGPLRPFGWHAGTYDNLSGADEVFEVGLNRASTCWPRNAQAARAAAKPPR